MSRPARCSGNLPAEATSFIGRHQELAEVRRTLSDARLVSLVGPGGVGKTRLAIRIATVLGRSFKNGVWLVQLAEIRDPQLIPSAVISALNLRDQAATQPLSLLLSYLHDKELMLVMDGCEHLVAAAAALVAALISASPGVRVLATSRQPLALTAEHVVPVPPLELPAAHESLARLRENEAVQLFCDRAAAAGGRFELTSSNQATVVDLCRRLDGLPLALELAAVRTRVLSMQQIRDRLSDRFALLTDGSRAALPRHQTLRLTIDWSYDLLDAAERSLFRRLCGFAGRFTLEDAEGVCTSDGMPAAGTLALLSALVDKSLVTKEEAEAVACYRLHETLREYALLKLREAGEAEALERRCAQYYHTRCWQSVADARYRLVEWLPWIDLEIDNIRVVLRQCVTRGDFTLGIDLVVSIGWFWITRATTEGLRWLDEFIAHGSGSEQAQALTYFLRGFLAMLKGDPTDRPWLERAAVAARVAQMLPLVASALSMASVAEGFAGNFGKAAQLLGEAERATGRLTDLPAIASLLQARSLNGFFRRDLEAVKSASSEGVRLCRDAGDVYPLEMMLINLGIAETLTGNVHESNRLYREALRIAQQIDHRVAQYYLLDLLARNAGSTGRAWLAARLIGAAQTLRTETGARMLPVVAALMAQPEPSLISALGPMRYRAEVDAGRQLGAQEAIRLALGESPPAKVATAARATADDGLLGKREAQVAKLVADGLSNRQIGVRLFISERTVDGHLRNILNKLGFNSRAQIAGWMARR